MSLPWSGRHSSLTPWLTSAPYPLPFCVVTNAQCSIACNANFQHLEEPDLLWTGAILADKMQKDCQECKLRDRDFLLDSMIGVGLYDNKATNTFVEKSMQYTTVNSSLLYDHIVSLENKVMHHYPSSQLRLTHVGRTRQ